MSVPPLPRIEGDYNILLELFTHSSLKDGSESEEYGDMDRLVQLGSAYLTQALTWHYFAKRPMLSADQISVEIANCMSPARMREWCITWNLKSKFRAAPGACDILEAPHEMQRFVDGYVGAMYLRNPLNQVQHWISSLIEPDAPQPLEPPPPVPPGGPPMQYALPAPRIAAPPVPAPYNAMVPQSPSALPAITLQKIHETATKHGTSISYDAQHMGGPAHAPVWRVVAKIDGVDCGDATAPSQKAAKEEAARKAFVFKGWRV
ncbi:hypothetical protein HMN09_00646900 [Mycena chlorophos]|uniref:DRBM domain-containing protein n=1 Tax=Mycena chlorophos TaxID=658473 RepID=A0A8H6T7Y4_MYCCL|nr:hypothetical protein HMN09_00646900 [Mycena chlorophos]